MARVALDVMGTDHGPSTTVSGAVLAAEVGYEVVLVGDKSVVEPLLNEAGADLSIVHAPDVIEMGDDPARALREKPDASVLTAAKLVRSGECEAMVSAGSTGAAMAAAAIVMAVFPVFCDRLSRLQFQLRTIQRYSSTPEPIRMSALITSHNSA